MPVMTVSTGRALIPGGSYVDRVRDTAPIAHWPGWEQSGTTAECLINSAQNGTYTRNITAMGTCMGIGDGNTAPIFTPGSDRLNVFTAAFQAAFNGSEGTILQWALVANVGVWTDGTNRRSLYFAVDGNNRIIHQKAPGNNQVTYWYEAGNVIEQNTFFNNTLIWCPWAITWSAADDEVRFFLNGIQQGATATVLGVWAGVFNANTVNIGCTDNLLADPWSGALCHTIVWKRALAPAAVGELSVV